VALSAACQVRRFLPARRATLSSGSPRPAAARAFRGGSFRRLVVRSDGAVHRPGTPPRLIPFPVAESLVVRASPSPTRDAFSIGDSSRNTKRGFDVVRFHGTRSHDRDTRTESNQSPALHGLSARGAWCRHDFADAQVSHLFSEVIAEDSIAVAEQVTREPVKGKCASSV
jgi:hypothetical protein